MAKWLTNKYSDFIYFDEHNSLHGVEGKTYHLFLSLTNTNDFVYNSFGKIKPTKVILS